MRTIHSVLGLALVGVALLMAACEGRVTLGNRCDTDAECNGLTCTFGRCRPDCTMASDCAGRGAVCVGEAGRGVCTIPSVDTCASGCEPGLVCALESCSTACLSSDECLTGATCDPSSGACVATGSIADAGQPDASRPDASRPDAGPATASTARTLCLGAAHVCATRAGTVYCWGRNNAGQLGDGPNDATNATHVMCPDGADCSATPVAVRTTSGTLSDIVDLACGETFTTALDRDGRVYSWGAQGDGGLGGPGRGGHIAVAIAGLEGVDHIVGGRYHTCARSGSSYRCWGHNATMEGSTILDDRLGTDTTMIEGATPLAAPAWEGASDLALGGYYTCALFATGVECRGTNESGVTGVTTTFEPTTSNAAIMGTAGATTIGSGVLHACVLLDGEPWCWGGGDHGELGPMPMACSGLSARCSGVPRRVPDPLGRTYTFLSHGYAEGTCAITDGEAQIVCWGINSAGASGHGDPGVNLDTLGDPIEHAGVALRGMVEVARGAATSCARDVSGSVFCWGSNESGQLGCGSPPDTETHPVACAPTFP